MKLFIEIFISKQSKVAKFTLQNCPIGIAKTESKCIWRVMDSEKGSIDSY